MYGQIGIHLLLTAATRFAQDVPVCNLVTIALLYLAVDCPPPKTPRWAQVAILTICLNTGQGWSLDGNLRPVGGLASVLASVIVAASQVLAVLGSRLLTAWFKQAEQEHRSKQPVALFNQLVFPTVWFIILEFLFWQDQTGLVSTQTNLYPAWFAGNHIELFLDAAIAQNMACTLKSIWFFRAGHSDTAPEHTCSKKMPQNPTSKLLQETCLLACLLGIMLLGSSIAFAVSRHSVSTIKIGCTRPQDPTSVTSVLHSIQEDVDHGGAIMLVPATAGYIHDVSRFIKFKSDITHITKNRATVVVPTRNFRNDTACEARMLLQIYPMGEKKFLNSYTNTVIKKTGKMIKEKHEIGSTFLTWRSRRVPQGQGSLLTATAICLDHEFPDIFRDDHSPDLLLIPNSAWSAAVHVNRIDSIRRFARRKSTAVLFCNDDISGYVDPTGRTITSTSLGSFSVDYNQKSRGRLPGVQVGLWWAFVPALLLLGRILHRLNTKHCRGTVKIQTLCEPAKSEV